MKESIRAARDEIAHNRNVAALKRLAGEDDAKVKELEDLRARRLPADVGSMMEREIMADILEGLASSGNRTGYPSDPVDESTVQLLADAGYDSLEAIRGASDEALLDIKGIGEAKLREIREKVG